jgi:hypothetical protein
MACPCGCSAISAKLTRFGHVKGCICRSCIGRRNRARGQRAHATAHRAAGGEGFTPSNEESARPYTLQIVFESKAGSQVPKSFTKFIGTDWFRRALSQSERGLPFGSRAKAGVAINGKWIVVKIK